VRGIDYPYNATLVDPGSPLCNFTCDAGFNLLVTSAARDCVPLNTSKPLFTFSVSLPICFLTPEQLQAYTLAIARALGVSPTRIAAFMAPPVHTATSVARRLLDSELPANTTTIQFVVEIPDFSPPPPPPQPPPQNASAELPHTGRRLLSDCALIHPAIRRLLYDCDLTLAAQIDAVGLLYALAAEIATDAFQARVNQALQDLGLAAAVVDTQSVEFHNVPPPKTAPPPPTPAPPPPIFLPQYSSATPANATLPPPALLALLALFALAYALPVADDY